MWYVCRYVLYVYLYLKAVLLKGLNESKLPNSFALDILVAQLTWLADLAAWGGIHSPQSNTVPKTNGIQSACFIKHIQTGKLSVCFPFQLNSFSIFFMYLYFFCLVFFSIFFIFFNFILFLKLYIIVLVLPNIKMNLYVSLNCRVTFLINIPCGWLLRNWKEGKKKIFEETNFQYY